MDIRALSIEGSFEITPRQFPDDRGVFLESRTLDIGRAGVSHVCCFATVFAQLERGGVQRHLRTML
jgi:dTDP-4-dehydrorhamnose 3,5-epimerase